MEKLGLGRKELRAWAMYDWANSAFVTIIISAVFPIYFSKVVNSGVSKHVATTRFAIVTTISVALIALLAPLLGAMADTRPIKKRLLAIFMGIGVAATVGLYSIGPGDWLLASLLFGLGNIGAMGSFVFYDSLLPHVASPKEMDRVSTAGYALGYVSGAILLIFVLQLIKHPHWLGLSDAGQATRLSFVITGVWWLLFSIPLFRHVDEPALVHAAPSKGGLLVESISQLRHTFRELRKYKQATLFLFAFLIYNDGIGTIIKFAAIYGEELHIEQETLILSIIVLQLVGIPFSFAFGQLPRFVGTKKTIYIGLLVYCIISILGYFMTSDAHFVALAICVGLVQGGVQALSRSLFASMIPAARSSEFFALFAVFEKFAGVFGPLLFALIGSFATSSRPAILAIIVFFVAGAALLTRVDVDAGRRQVQD